MIYVLYETYCDDIKQLKEQTNNTKIIGVFDDLEIANEYISDYLDKIITQDSDNVNWFFKEIKNDLIDNTNIIKVYDIFNDEIDNYEEHYSLILEKSEIIQRKEDDYE